MAKIFTKLNVGDTVATAENACFKRLRQDGLEYTIYNDRSSYVVSGIGTCTDSDVIIPPYHNGLPVVGIGDSAFSSCESLKSIVIPDTVQFIFNNAFEFCNSLTSIVIPDNVIRIYNYAFYSCRSLKSVVIGNGVTLIDDWVFESCTSLTSVVIGDSVTEIGNYAFYGCRSLKSIVIPDSVTWIGNHAFQYCHSLTSVTIPDSVTSIGEDAFYYCTGLTSVVIGNGVTSISENAFYDCESLESVVIGNGVTSIGKFAFRACTSLTSVVIPDSVTSIDSHAFSECESLTSVVIGNGAKSIDDYAFNNCESLTNISVSLNNKYYKNIDGNLYSKDGKKLIQYAIGKTATTFTIPNSVTDICHSAFTYCKSLTSVVIGKGVTDIKDQAFSYCKSLTNISVSSNNNNYEDIDGNLYFKPLGGFIQYAIGKTATTFTIPNDVYRIGSHAFCGCTSLTSVTIPDSVTNVGGAPFRDCTSLIYNDYDNARYLGNGNNPYLVLVKEKSTSITSCTIHPKTKIIAGSALNGAHDSLKSIVIPNSVTFIGSGAFSICESLTDVYYTGSKSEWNKITIYSVNDPLINATIHYNYNNKLSPPTISISGSVISITGSNNVSVRYWIYVNGESLVSTTENSTSIDIAGLNLAAGTYSVYLVAVADGYYNSEPSNTVEYVVR